MEITGEYLIRRDIEAVWTGLNDPELLRRCIPGCESMEATGDDEYHALILAAVGPVRARFKTRISLSDLDPPRSYTIGGEAKGGAAGFGRGSADVRLSQSDAGTTLVYAADFKVGGKLAQVGSRLVAGATRKTADEFFRNFSEALDPGAVAVAGPAAAPRRVWPWVAGAAALLLLIVILLIAR